MNEMDIKQNFSKNLSVLRKSRNMTQAELAEKLNYSDKSISKWERGDVLPDITTFKMIADFFGIKVDELITADKRREMSQNGKRALITSLSCALVFFIATLALLFYSSFRDFEYAWLFYVYAVPISCIILIIFTSKWFSTLSTMISVSGLVWSLSVSVYLSILLFAHVNLWFIFVVCAVFQVLVLIWFKLLDRAKKEREESENAE